MKRFLNITFAIIFITGTILAQGDLSKDRDYQNFKRNYVRATKAFDNLNSCKTQRCHANAVRYTKYSRKFIDKLVSKYGKIKFADELDKITEIENELNKKDKVENQTKDDLKYVQLWMYRLKPQSLNSFAINSNFKDFDRDKLLKVYSSVKNTDDFKRRIPSQDIEDFELALNDFDSFLQKASVLDNQKGIIGMQMERSKTIQDKNYYVKTLTIAKDAAESLLKISPDSQIINAKLSEINNLIANADTQVKANKPKLVKKYKDSLPKAVVRNRKIEKQFVDAIRFQKFPDVTITGAIITSPNWIVQKSADYRSVYRWREGVVTAKNSDGDCWFQTFSFKQPYTGSGFGKAIRSGSGQRYYIECSKIK